jgi:hypothetical protein
MNILHDIFCWCKKRNKKNENEQNEQTEQNDEITKTLPLLVYNSFIPLISLIYFHIMEIKLTFTQCDILVPSLTICSIGYFMYFNINSLWRKLDIICAYTTCINYFVLSILQHNMNIIYDTPKILSILYLYKFSASFNEYVGHHYQYLVIDDNDDEHTQRIKEKLLIEYHNTYNGDKYNHYLIQVVHIPFRICAYTYCTIVHFKYYGNFLNETQQLQITTNIIQTNIYISLIGCCFYYKNYIV